MNGAEKEGRERVRRKGGRRGREGVGGREGARTFLN